MNRIKDLRSANGWTQQDLATKMNTAKSVVSRYETEKLGLDAALICRLCDIFGCTADYLIGRSANPNAIIPDEDSKILRAYHSARIKDRQMIDLILAEYMESSKEKNAG